MADQDRPNQSANRGTAEGERWKSEEDTIRTADRDENPEQRYDAEDAAGFGRITNRPLSEEVHSQEEVPARGASRDNSGDPDATRREGDSGDSER